MSEKFEETIDPEKGIVHKTIPETLVAGFSFRSGYEELRKLIPANLEKLGTLIRESICGPAMVLLDYGVYSDAAHVEAAYPVTSAVEKEGIRIRTLGPAEVLSVTHHGSHEDLSESYKKLYGFMREHGEPGTSYGREIYTRVSHASPEENVTELQAVIHGWQGRFIENAQRVLGEKAAQAVSEGHESLFTLRSSKDEKMTWIKNAMEKLDTVANTGQKFNILSCCAHEFSDMRIAQLRDIYEKTGSVDEVLEFIRNDYDWYEAPRREGDAIYVTKIPYNRKAYEEAKTRDEKRKSYCHCSLVRDYLDSGISHTFCYCGTGWYRQIWEGVLGRPVTIEILKSLVKGDDTCDFAIHIPRDSIERRVNENGTNKDFSSL